MSELTPLMKQYYALKQEANGALLFFRMGDFYELFAEDALVAAPILGITLTSRDKKTENPTPMAGVPYHSAQAYIQKLLNAGKKVAIAEQFLPEGVSADQLKGIVERKLVRTFTPAVQFELSEASEQKFLATVMPSGQLVSADSLSDKKTDKKGDKKPTFILGLFDPATGKVLISEALTVSDLFAVPLFGAIKHFLNSSVKTPIEILNYFADATPPVLVEDIPHNWVADADTAVFLQNQYQKQVLHPLLSSPAAQKVTSLLIQYTLKTQGLQSLPHLHEPSAVFEKNRLQVGPNTHTHLDTPDLFKLINHTQTSMGARSLRQRLDAPFKNVPEIRVQQEAIQELAQSLHAPKMQECLKQVYDLDRILGRISTKLAHPRDTVALGKSLASLFQMDDLLRTFKSKQLQELNTGFAAAQTQLAAVTQQILKTQKPDAPIHMRDGGIFELGTDPELDRLIQLSENGERFLLDLEARERAATGISSLKVKYNRVFGYFIEISSANLGKTPSHYQRKQTMVGGERFFTEELKKFEEEILTSSQKQKALEAELFQKLLDELIRVAEHLKQIAEITGELDCLLSLSLLVQSPGWCFPQIDEGYALVLKGSRHPVVDAALHGKFVANDFELNESTVRTLLITGPNMGGKSTIMRQVAQIILLGQMGAPVPATAAQWGVFHSIYTRIGAQDAITKGQSTFMVEMVELAHILNHADQRSFVVLDEVGRGTSTYDGMSVASASLEHLHLKSGARIVFATHYHELTTLEEKLPGLKNAHVKVKDDQGKLTFLYELAPGRSSKSFGIQVAELAGLPKPVIRDAWKILKQLEERSSALPVSDDPNQLSLFGSLLGNEASSADDTRDSEISESEPSIPPATSTQNNPLNELPGILVDLDLDLMRPIEALHFLSELKKKLQDSG